MVVDYYKQNVYTQSINIEDIGNTSLRCNSDTFGEYYFSTRTIMGKTMILKFGPVVPDMPIISNGFATFYKKIDFKIPSIKKDLDNFINDPKKEIVSIEEISLDELQASLPSLDGYFISDDDLCLNNDLM